MLKIILRRHKKVKKAANVLLYISWLPIMGKRQNATDGINCGIEQLVYVVHPLGFTNI